MPALPPVPKTIKVQVEGLMGSSNWANIWYLQYAGAGPPTAADLTTLSGTFSTAYEAFQQCVDTNVSVSRIVMTDLHSNIGAQGSGGAGWSGSKTGDPLPINVAACITKTIARRYRGGHPRFYLPGMVITDCLNERAWSTTAVTLLSSRAAIFFTSANAMTSTSTGTLKLASVSYYHSPTPGGGSVLKSVPDVDLITGFKVDSRIDSQRRRLS